jgi:excisionase family DNA binding protein
MRLLVRRAPTGLQGRVGADAGPGAAQRRRLTASGDASGRGSSGNWESGVMAGTGASRVDRLLTVAQVAELLGTTERFPRRLIAERRITFVRVGRHVRIPESALAEFIAAGIVEPVTRRRRRVA